MRGQYPINPNVYNGGATVVSTAPFAQFFVQQQAKRQAKEDALNSYYNDQAKALTPTGMRAKDIEGGWSQKFNQWQQLGIQNRKALLNPTADNYKTLNEFNRLANELKADIQRSKEYGEMEKQLREAKMSGKWNPTDDDFEIASDIGYSIYDPKRKGYTLDALSLNTPPLDVHKFNQNIIGQAKRNKQVVGEPKFDSQKGIQTIITEEVFAPDQLKAIAENAALQTQNDRSARVFFQHALESSDLPNLQAAYSKIYGNDIVDTPEKAAKAFTIMQNSSPTGRTEEIKNWDDPDRKLRDQKELAAFNSSLRKNEARLEASLKGKEGAAQQSAISQHIDGIIQKATSKPPKPVTISGKTYDLYDVPVTPSLAKSLEKVDALGEKRQPNAIRVDKNGNFYGIFYKPEVDEKTNSYTGKFQKTASGNPKIEGDLTTTVTRDVFQPQYASEILTPKAVEGSLAPSPPPATSAKPTTPSKPIKLTKGIFD